jgi:hypothetical protein
VAEIEQWRDPFLLGAENALRARAKDEEAWREEELKRLQRGQGGRADDGPGHHEEGDETPPFVARERRRSSRG